MVKLTSISTLILFAGVALAKCDDKELAAVKAEFYSNGIVPDVLPSFDPKALAYITFDYKNGSEPETILTPGTRIGRNGTVSHSADNKYLTGTNGLSRQPDCAHLQHRGSSKVHKAEVCWLCSRPGCA